MKKFFGIGFFLILSLGFFGCDNGTTSGNEPTKFEGTWFSGSYKIECTGNNWTFFVSNNYDTKGTFSFNDIQLNLNGTHYYEYGKWERIPSEYQSTATGNYVLTDNTMVLTGFPGLGVTNRSINLTWTR